jgi:hypothetical protein
MPVPSQNFQRQYPYKQMIKTNMHKPCVIPCIQYDEIKVVDGIIERTRWRLLQTLFLRTKLYLHFY